MGFFDFFKSAPNCPNCNQQLESMPKSSGTCNHCKKKFYMCKDNETKKQLLTTAEGRQNILLKNRNLKRLNEWFNPWLHTTDKIRSEKMNEGLIQGKNDWYKKNPNGTFNNFLWSTLNEEIFESVKRKDYDRASQLYKNMAIILNEEGKDNNKILCEAHKMELSGFKQKRRIERKEYPESDIIVTIEESYSNRESTCDNCNKLIGKEMLLDEAIKLKLLPVQDCTCTNGYCDCYYLDDWKLNE